MYMVGTHGHGAHMGIWLHGCMRLGSTWMLIHVHGCNGLTQHAQDSAQYKGTT